MNYEEEYRKIIRKELNEWTERLINEIKEIDKLKFYEGIDLLDFEIHYKYSIVMYTMEKDANEFFPNDSDRRDDLYYGSKSILEDMDDELYERTEIYDDKYRKLGVDTYEEGSKELMLWFAECWDKSQCINIKLPVYMGIHDHSPLYDVINKEWKENGDQWEVGL